MSNHQIWLRNVGRVRQKSATALWPLLLAATFIAVGSTGRIWAADNDFNIQVSPSPLTVTLSPGQHKTATLTVRNLTSHSETLVPSLNGFTIDSKSEKIELTPDVPLGLKEWISFKQQKLIIAPGASQPLDIIYSTPSDAGFSYALAITLNPPDRLPDNQGANFKPAVAVFNLINIDRADAKRQLEITNFTSSKSRYEYLPASFTLTLANKGNVIDQPTGNLFIQRSYTDSQPITTIPINSSNRYILPETTRAFTTTWGDGFPKYTTTSGDNQLQWRWKDIDKLRMGRYVAKVVLIYNDGQRDIPLIASTTFWVIPWKLILVTLVVGVLVITGVVAWIRLVLKGTKRVQKYARRK